MLLLYIELINGKIKSKLSTKRPHEISVALL